MSVKDGQHHTFGVVFLKTSVLVSVLLPISQVTKYVHLIANINNDDQ